jgi:hypothetical protein
MGAFSYDGTADDPVKRELRRIGRFWRPFLVILPLALLNMCVRQSG